MVEITTQQLASMHMAIFSTICAALIAYIIGMFADKARDKNKVKQLPKVDLDYWEKKIS